jgi:hypothetical protein
MSGESVCWINHFHFTIARTFSERHLERDIIPSKKERERGKEITIKFKINKDYKSGFCYCLYCLYYFCCLVFYVGICTPKQINDVMVGSLGDKYCGLRVNRIYISIFINYK